MRFFPTMPDVCEINMPYDEFVESTSLLNLLTSSLFMLFVYVLNSNNIYPYSSE